MADIMKRETGMLEYPYGQTSTDEEILAAVLNALHHNSGVPNDRIRAEVKSGHVVLSGVVAQDFERKLAEQAAESAPGVLEVTSQITLES